MNFRSIDVNASCGVIFYVGTINCVGDVLAGSYANGDLVSVLLE